MNELISVIVPIYNVEEYLPNCIESILRQTYKHLEIVLVDDGSPDRCGEICEEYAKKDDRIRVIHKENGGLSDARNKGMSIATGKYFTFIDSDDYISEDYVEYLYKLLKEHDADISVCDLIMTSSMKETEQKDSKSVFKYSVDEALEAMLYAKVFSTSADAKLYKRELFEGVEYPIGKYMEDLFTTYRLICKSKRIVCGKRVCYYYYHREGSITQSVFSEKHLHRFEALKTMYETEIKNRSEIVQKAYRSMMVSSMAALLAKQPPKSDRIDEIWREVKKYLVGAIINSKNSKRIRAQAFLMLFGRKVATFIIVRYYAMKWDK